MSEREQRLDGPGVEPAISHQQPLGVADLERGRIGWSGAGRQIGFGPREGDRQLARGFDLTEQHAGDRLAAPDVGYQAATTAATRSIHGMTTGLPCSRTTIVRELAAATWSINASWWSGRCSVCRSTPSSSHWFANTIATSARAASAAAAAGSAPSANSTRACGASARIAASGDDGIQTWHQCEGPGPARSQVGGTAVPSGGSTCPRAAAGQHRDVGVRADHGDRAGVARAEREDAARVLQPCPAPGRSRRRPTDRASTSRRHGRAPSRRASRSTRYLQRATGSTSRRGSSSRSPSRSSTSPRSCRRLRSTGATSSSCRR
jgi:hypothetical protein